MIKKILLLPGWMTGLDLYGEYDGLSIQFGKINKDIGDAYVIGFSLGALVALRDWNGKGKLVLVNPPLPKKNILIWLIRWLKFILSEGLFLERQKFTKNPFRYVIEIARCIGLLRMDFSKRFDDISKENLVIFRGKNDKFFCDDEAVKFMQAKGLRVIEVENCGHGWSENMEKALEL